MRAISTGLRNRHLHPGPFLGRRTSPTALLPRDPSPPARSHRVRLLMLPRQFDEYIWIDRTSAVKPFDVAELKGQPDTYPFGV